MDTAGTITAHHLYLTGDDSQTDPLAFCKPIAKKPSDRDVLIKAVRFLSALRAFQR
jgi:dihydroorotase